MAKVKSEQVAATSPWEIVWNDKTDSAWKLYGRESLAYTGSPEDIAKQFFSEHDSLLHIDITFLSLGAVDTVDSHTFVCFSQEHDGIPIYGGNVSCLIKMGEVVSVPSNYYPSIEISTTPFISNTQAVEYARGWASEPVFVENLEQPREAQLVIVSHENEESYAYLLSWRVELASSSQVFARTYFVNADTGDLLFDENLIDYQNTFTVEGTVKGFHYPEHHTQTPVEIELGNTHVKIGNVSLADVAVITTEDNATTNSTGKFQSRQLIPRNGDPFLSVKTIGKWAKVIDRSNTVATTDYFSSGAFKSFKGNLSGIVNGDATIDDTVMVTVYYHINIIHDYLKKLGFDKMDRQIWAYTNYVENDRDRYDNAHYNRGNQNLYFGSGDDYARESAVIYHEYCHAVQTGFRLRTTAISVKVLQIASFVP